MNSSDLGRFRVPTDPRLHPDGERVAFVVTQMDIDADCYHRQIWLWDRAGARPLTQGFVDVKPRWSPDGSTLLFLRAPLDSPRAFRVMTVEIGDTEPSETGDTEPSELAAFKPGVREAEWSPDGTAVAVVAAVWTAEYDGLDDAERDRRPARLTRATWRWDNEDPKHDRRVQLFRVDAASGEIIRLTDDDFDLSDATWSPDGSRIAFVSARHDTRFVEPGNQPWEIDAVGGEPEPLADIGRWSMVCYDRTGSVHLVGDPDPWGYPGIARVLHLDPSGALSDLSGQLDRDVDPFSPPLAPKGPRFTDASTLTPLEDSGRLGVVRLGPEIDWVIGGDRVISGFDVSSTGSTFVFVASTPTDPGELYRWEAGEESQLSDLNLPFKETAGLVEPKAFTAESEGVDIHAWAYLPPGDEQVPLLLSIHGGPNSQYGYGFFDEFQVYASAGFGVVACNPRGSSGRGREFSRAVVGRWSEEEPPDMVDLKAVVSAALEAFPRLDPDRMGVMGGSYGGFATARLTAIDHRFRSSVVERALAAFESFTGSSDIGPWFGEMYLGARLPEGADVYRAASPLSVAHRITTPTLVLHSEEDWRCPIEQGQQLFTMLQMQGVPSEMLRFPGEGHELSRSGKPRHRVERFEAVLDWHRRHLV